MKKDPKIQMRFVSFFVWAQHIEPVFSVLFLQNLNSISSYFALLVIKQILLLAVILA